MAAITKLYADIAALVDSLVYNPSKRFITASDIQNFVNVAAIEVAVDIGGINYIDTTNTSVANQRDYTPANNYKKIIKAQYVTNIGLTTETVTHLDIITADDKEFIDRLSMNQGNPDNWSLAVAGTPTVTPKYIIWWPELATFRLSDTPSVTGDTIKLWALGIPAALSSGVQYDGDQMELQAIAYRVSSMARLKSRETMESGVFDQKYDNQIAKIRKIRSKMRQVRQAQDGRFYATRLRSVNGAK